MQRDEVESAVLKATRDFEHECRALKACESCGRTLRFICSAELRQDNTDSFPGGYLRISVMSMVPGQSVIKIERLTREDLAIIRPQLTETLE